MASSSTTSLRPALLLLALFHASLSWDSSNIWFPDTNNPVFYNMSFYQQAVKNVETEPPPSENLIPVTEPPRFNTNTFRPRPRPPVFNPLPEQVTWAPTRPTETARPNRNRFTTSTPVKPNRNRQPSKFSGRIQGGGQSEIGRLAAEQQMFIRNEQNSQMFRNPNQGTNVAPQSAFDRLAAEQQMFIRNEQNSQRSRNPGEGIKVSPQSGNRRSKQQHKMFVRNEQGFNTPDFIPEVAVGYKTVPLEATTSISTLMYYNNQHANPLSLSVNRLRRTKNEGIADGGNYFNRNNGGGANNGQFADEQRRWNGNRDATLSQARPEVRRESNSNGIGSERNFERSLNPAEENRRRWNTAGTSGSDVATNVIADIETSSKATGPSKCVWAIISCCKPSSLQIRYSCFESLGCHGAFWDTNPCSKEMTNAAVQATANFYNIPPRTEE